MTNSITIKKYDKMSKLRSTFNSKAEDITGHYETSKLPSKTVPNMTLSIKELVERYIRGENVTVFEAQYTGEDELIDTTGMSEMDMLDASRQIGEYIKDTQQATRPKANKQVTPITETPEATAE